MATSYLELLIPFLLVREWSRFQANGCCLQLSGFLIPFPSSATFWSIIIDSMSLKPNYSMYLIYENQCNSYFCWSGANQVTENRSPVGHFGRLWRNPSDLHQNLYTLGKVIERPLKWEYKIEKKIRGLRWKVALKNLNVISRTPKSPCNRWWVNTISRAYE